MGGTHECIPSRSLGQLFFAEFLTAAGLVARFSNEELRCSLSIRYMKFKGLNGQHFKNPIIGALAETQASK
jgi:hypothetical protein